MQPQKAKGFDDKVVGFLASSLHSFFHMSVSSGPCKDKVFYEENASH